jgi:hypothetical protein
MATPQERSWYILQLVKKESVTAMQSTLCTQFHTEPQSLVSFYAWYNKFEHELDIFKHKSPGRSSVCDATVDRVQTCFRRSQQKSVCQVSCELQLPQMSSSSSSSSSSARQAMRALDFLRNFCQLSFSIATFHQFFTPEVLISWITSSFHLSLGLPLFLISIGLVLLS